jgi:hypothetical protein
VAPRRILHRMVALQRWTGYALVWGGALTFLLNAILTPLMPGHLGLGEGARLPVFAWRQGASALAAACLLLGTVGLFLRQAERPGAWGRIWFLTAFLGSASLLGHEWSDVFFLRALALRDPAALASLENHGLGLYDIGAMIALGLFTLGWLGFTAWTAGGRILPRGPALLVIAGFVAVPFLGAAFRVTGAVLGNAILGGGWCWLGYEVSRPD